MMSYLVIEKTQSVTDVVAMLADLGYGAENLDSQFDLVIDKFDQWTNPPGLALYCTCCAYDADALQPAA